MTRLYDPYPAEPGDEGPVCLRDLPYRSRTLYVPRVTLLIARSRRILNVRVSLSLRTLNILTSFLILLALSIVRRSIVTYDP